MEGSEARSSGAEKTVARRALLRCWGDFALIDAATGEDLKPRGRKARALIAYLGMHAGKPVSRERLMGLLWGERAEQQARASLRQSVAELRNLAHGAGLLAIERDHLSLEPDALLTDFGMWRDAAEQGRFRELVASLPEPDERLFANLDGLDPAFDDWLAIERARQCDALAGLIADASAAALAAGQVREARTLRVRLGEIDAEAAAAVPAFPGDQAAIRPGRIVEAERWQRWRVAALVAVLLSFSVMAIAAWQFRRDAVQAAPATIAVLPFRDLSGGRGPHFADGMSEEVMAQLARQPGLRLAGRTSSWQFRDGSSDPRQIGRRLGVAYVLEGSVRRSGEQVRVNVALVKAADGMQLWAETFEGTLDDALAIQSRIGAQVASTLTHRLVQARPPSGPLATSGAVYSHYLSARGLIRERNPAAFRAAKARLLLALQIDPGFAPAWSSLAQVEGMEGQGASPEARIIHARAVSHARRALALAPDLAEAHGVLGMLHRFEHPVARRHIARAVTLDPSNAEFQFWLGNAHGAHDEFSLQLQAYRRAFVLDPLWSYAQEYALLGAWQMGQRSEARTVLRRVEVDGSRYQRHLIRAVQAGARGDFSEEAHQYVLARRATDDPGRRAAAAWMIGMVFRKLGLFDRLGELDRDSQARWSQESSGRDHYREIRSGRLPTVDELRSRNDNATYFFEDMAYVAIASKLLVNSGRADEVLTLYDSPQGIMRLRRGTPPEPSSRFYEDAPVIVAALRSAGREQEARRLLARLDRKIADALRRNQGAAPNWFWACAAYSWALAGKHEAALSGLERAVTGGWSNVAGFDDSTLRDIGEEPAFGALRGNPRFERIRARLKAHYQRERQETRAIEV